MTHEQEYVLAPLTSNLGRGDTGPQFRANVFRVLAADDRAVIGWQEIDEADGPNEHAILFAALDPTDHRIGWETYEPLVVPWMLDVKDQRVTFACQGTKHLSPIRHIVEAVVSNPAKPDVPPVVVMNMHPPINRPGTLLTRAHFKRVHRARVAHWYRRGFTVIWMGDMNSTSYPRTHRGEKTFVHAGFDNIRAVVHPKGAQLWLLSTGRIDQTIDKHNGHFARLRLTPPK